jgi:predicted  nucleic acid-binding Zn-ribbon protein
MDLLACTKCGDQFYLPGVRTPTGRGCPNCGGDLCFALRDIASIPLDARWLDSHRDQATGHRTVAAKSRQLTR